MPMHKDKVLKLAKVSPASVRQRSVSSLADGTPAMCEICSWL